MESTLTLSSRRAVASARPIRRGLLIAAAVVCIAGCTTGPDGGPIDLSPGQQDITFKLAVGNPILQRGGVTRVSVTLSDDDPTGDFIDPAERRPFSGLVDLRLVEPLPPGVTATFESSTLGPGQTTLELVATNDAPLAVHNLLLAGTIRDSTTTVYKPFRLAVGGDCVEGLPRAVGISAGAARSAAVLEDGSVVMWGFNHPGTLSDATAQFVSDVPLLLVEVPSVAAWLAPQRVQGITSAVRVETSRTVTGVYLADQTHVILGPYLHSPVGSPLAEPGWSKNVLPINLPVSSLAYALPPDYSSYVALADERVPLHLFRNNNGVIEDSTYAVELAPVKQIASTLTLLQGLNSTNGLDRAYVNSLVILRTDGSVHWVRSLSARPEPVPELDHGVSAIAAGAQHFVALMADGTVREWGIKHGDLVFALEPQPDGGARTGDAPVHLNFLSDIVAVAAGDGFSLALRNDGTVVAWGYDDDSGLGDRRDAFGFWALRVPELDGVVAIAAGSRHALALRYDGTVWAWGTNSDGQLGDANTAAWSPDADEDAPRRRRPLPVLGIGRGAGTRQCTAAPPPLASFTVTPTRPIVGENVSFDGSGSDAGAGEIRSYEWDVSAVQGQGQPEIVEDRLVGPTASYAFRTAGDHRVRLSVTNTRGEVAETSTIVSVSMAVGGAVSFSDAEFGRSEWTMTFARVGVGHEFGATQVLSDGNPAAFRRATIQMAAEPNAVGNALSVYHWKKGAVYEPRSSGAVTSIEYSIDSKRVTAGVSSQSTGLIVRQGGRIYIAARQFPFWAAWQKLSLVLRPDEFVEIGPEVIYLVPDSHPDFSATGGALEFGFAHAVYRPVGGIVETYETGIDNWRVTLHR